jgi:hypothetical protein
MKKQYLLGLVGCAVLMHTASAWADPVYNLAGFLDYTYTGVNDLVPATESKFNGLGELDIGAKALQGKLGGLLDLNFLVNSANQGSTKVEQAFLTWNITDRLGVDVGEMNSGLGWEKQDPTDLYTISHGQLFTFFDNQTSGLYGNNVEGAFIHGAYNKVNARLGFLNDLGDTANQNSLLIQGGADIINGVNVQGSIVTQHGQSGNLLDLNSTYRRGPLLVGLELMTAEHDVDYAWGATGHLDLNNRFGVTGRVDYMNFANANAKNIVAYTVDGIWTAMENLQLYAEYRADDNGTWNNSLFLQALARFQ